MVRNNWRVNASHHSEQTQSETWNLTRRRRSFCYPIRSVEIAFLILFFPCLALGEFDASRALGLPTNPNPLMKAIIANDIRGVTEAVEVGIDPNIPSEEGIYPILLAGAYGNLDVLKILLARDVELNVKARGSRNVMHFLAMRGAVEPIKLLSILNPQLVLPPDSDGWTPLFMAYANSHLAVAEFILANNYDSVNRTAKAEELIAFAFIEKMDRPEAIQHMIKHNLNVLKRNADDQTLHEAAKEAEHPESEALLKARYEAVLDAHQKRLLERMKK